MTTGTFGPAGLAGKVNKNGTGSRGPATILPSSSRSVVPISVPAPARILAATNIP
jgi:hypothetical protein